MTSPQNRSAVLRLLHKVFLAVQIGLLGVGYMLIQQEGVQAGPRDEEDVFLLIILGVLAVAAAIASFLLPNIILASNKPASGLTPDDGPAVFTASVMRMTLQEAVGLFGFVVGILQLDLAYMLPFSVFSIALLICFPPR